MMPDPAPLWAQPLIAKVGVNALPRTNKPMAFVIVQTSNSATGAVTTIEEVARDLWKE